MPKLELVAAKAQMVKSLEEYYNSIRTNIQFSGRNYKIITLTSAQPGEGKSTTSMNIAISFAKAGFRTLFQLFFQFCDGTATIFTSFCY